MLAFVGAVMLLVTVASVARFCTPNKFQADWYPSIPFQEGTSYATWSFFSINATQARADYQKMVASGVEWVAINSFWYQANLTSNDIYPGFWTEPRENLVDAFLYARSIGLHVLYKPMIQIDGEWRAHIQYSPEWMQAYTDWLVSCAQDAELGGVEMFCLGCEMNNMQGHSDAVRSMIAAVRQVFHGKLTYSANYDAFWYIDWYDKIDMIGVSMYPAMSFSYSPTVDELVQFWNGFYTRLEALSAKWNKPIAFTEIGAQALDGSNMSPSQNRISNKSDVEELCDIYQSVFESRLWTAPWFKGVYWWIWDNYEPDPLHPENDINFSPEIPAVLAILTATYTAPHQYIPSDFLTRLLVPLSVGITTFVILAWKLGFAPKTQSRSKAEDGSETSSSPPTSLTPSASSQSLPSPARFAVVQGMLVGILFYIVYAHVIFPVYVTFYYHPDAIVGYLGITLGTILFSRFFLRYTPRFSLQSLLILLFTLVIACPILFFGISIDGTWLKFLGDMILLGIVIVALIRVNEVCPKSGKRQHTFQITTGLLNFLFLLACSVFFDQMAVSFAVVPIGLGIFLVSSNPAQDHVVALTPPAPTSSLPTNPPMPARGRNMKLHVSLLLSAFLAGVLLPIASSSFNLLYMNLLPLILSILPPVLAGGLIWAIYLLWSRWHKHDDSMSVPDASDPATRTFPLSLQRTWYCALILEGVATLVVVTNGPHLVWSMFAGVFVILFVSTMQFYIMHHMQNRKSPSLFYFLLGVILMLGAGTSIHAIKGSLIYSIMGPVPFNVVVAINLVVLAGCLLLTLVGLLFVRKGFRSPLQKVFPG